MKFLEAIILYSKRLRVSSKMEYLAIYEDHEQLASINDEPAAEEIVKSSRKRLRLCDKRRIVDR
jgi:hypothetical protein